MATRERFNRTKDEVNIEAAATVQRLNKATGDTWEHTGDKQSCWVFNLKNQHGHSITVSMNDCDKKSNPKYTVSVAWPGGRSHRHNPPENDQSFGCGYNRGTDALVDCIVKRALPHLQAHWQERLDEIARVEGNEDSAAATVARLEKRFGREQAEHNKGSHVVYGNSKSGIYKVQVNHDGTAGCVEIRSSIPIDKVFALIDWMEQNVGG